MEDINIKELYKSMGVLEERNKIMALLLDAKYLEDFKDRLSKYLKSLEDK